MNIHHTQNETKGFYTAESNAAEAERMTYSRAGANRIIIDHTEVHPDFNGQGVGKKLVMAAVEHARSNNLRILPLCPFARSVFDRTEEIRDVL